MDGRIDPKQAALILGSARSEGDTALLAEQIQAQTHWPVVDLLQYRITPYNYEHQYPNDDFLALVKSLLTYPVWVMATPVYWYTMSSVMKVFFDRITDLLKIEKDLGRSLRGKNLAVITSSNGDHLGAQFFLPFQETARYLGMTFLAGQHTLPNQNNQELLASFIQQINVHANLA